MKKEVKDTLLFLFVVLTISLQSTQRFIVLPYVLRNVFLYILIVYIGYVIIRYFTKKLLSDNPTKKKENIVIITRTIMFILLVVLVGGSQLFYIAKRDTSYLRRCEYYDDYSNIIYESLYIGSCPDIEVLDKNDEELIFRVEEEAIGITNFNTFRNRGIVIDEVDDFVTAVSLTDIAIKYDENHYVESFNIKLSEYITYSEDGIESQIYYGYHRIVDTIFGENFNTALKEADYIEYSNGFNEDLAHHQFSDDDYTGFSIYAVDAEETEDSLADTIIIKESVKINGETKSEELLEIRHNNDNTSISAFYDANWDIPIYTQVNLLKLNNFIMKESITRTRNIGLTSYDISYFERNGVYYINRLGSVEDFSPNKDFGFESVYIWYENEEYNYLTNTSNDIIEFHETDYGMKVINRRIFKFDFFRDNEEQLLEVTFKYNLDDYQRLHNYYLELVELQYYDPQFIVRDLNPILFAN